MTPPRAPFAEHLYVGRLRWVGGKAPESYLRLIGTVDLKEQFILVTVIKTDTWLNDVS